MTGNIAIYQTADNRIEVEIDNKNETIWLNKNDIAKLFGIDRSGVSRHINNIFKSAELSLQSNVQKMHIPNSDKPVEFYNLDVILAVGYRANSGQAITFRRWATGVLRQYLVDGYALNEKLLKEKQEQIVRLRESVNLFSRAIVGQAKNLEEAKSLAQLLTDFSAGLDLLDGYDNKTLDISGKSKKAAIVIKKEEFLQVIDKMKPEFDSDVFANPKDESFDSSINQIYQTFGGQDCYPTLEEKAAMLLYFLVKNHSFTDGNKRIGAACFLYFLNRNNMLYSGSGILLDNAALFALTLLIAESKPEEKDTMKQVIVSVLNRRDCKTTNKEW